jgi:propionate kinase
MTPLEGLVMGTRCGDVDFGAMAWIAQQTGSLSRIWSAW